MNKSFTVKIVFKALLTLAVYFSIGILLQIILFKNAYYCPFRYGACGPTGIEYLITWLFNTLWWPIELIFFILFSLPGASLTLW
jgi:hypothetical protein